MDDSTTVADLKALVSSFTGERSWEKFHNPKSLSMAIAVEAAELMEVFSWRSDVESADAIAEDRQVRRAASEELADIVIFALAFANNTGIDLAQSVMSKVEKNRAKYPADEFKGLV